MTYIGDPAVGARLLRTTQIERVNRLATLLDEMESDQALLEELESHLSEPERDISRNARELVAKLTGACARKYAERIEKSVLPKTANPPANQPAGPGAGI